MRAATIEPPAGEAKSHGQRRQRAFRILSCLLAIVVPIVVIESLLTYVDHRTLGAHTHVLKWGARRVISLKEASPGREIEWVPAGDFLEQSDGYLEKREYLYEADAQGFLMPSFVHKNPDISVIFQGGSTTEIVFVDPEQRFPYLVGRQLEKRTAKKVNSLNAGVSGAYTLDMINALNNKLAAYRPTFLVLMEDINDLNTLLYNNSSYYGPIRGTIEEIDGKTFRRERSILRSSLSLADAVLGQVIPHLYLRLLGAGAWMLGISEQNDEFAAVRDHKHLIDPRNIRENFRRNLLLYVMTARQYGSTPVLMTQPSRFYDDDPEWSAYIKKNIEAKTHVPFSVYRELHRSLNEVTRDVGREAGVTIIDLEAKIPPRSEFIHDAVHFNNNGSRLAAKIITDELVARYFTSASSH